VVSEFFIGSRDGIEAGRRSLDGGRTGKIERMLVGLQLVSDLGDASQGRAKDNDRCEDPGQVPFHGFSSFAVAGVILVWSLVVRHPDQAQSVRQSHAADLIVVEKRYFYCQQTRCGPTVANSIVASNRNWRPSFYPN
jgi:hypothetical protein